jgi:capsular exopolysaccharide synthesis family protein
LLRQYAWLLTLSIVISLVLGAGLWYVLLRYSPRFTSETQLNISGGIHDPYQLIQRSTGWTGASGMGLIDAYIKNQTVRIRSNEILDGAIARDVVRNTQWFKSFNNDIRRAREDMGEALGVSRIKESTLIHITFTCGNEKDPQVILDAVVGVYLAKLAYETGNEAANVRRTFTRERKSAEDELNELKEQMRQYRIQHDLPALEARNNEAAITYEMLAEEQAKISVTYESAHKNYQAMLNAHRAGDIGYSQQQLTEVETDPSIARRRERLWTMREQRQVLLERFGEKHRVVREIDLQITATEQEIKRETDRLVRKLQSVRLEATKRMMDGLVAQSEGIRPKIEEARNQLRDLGVNLEKYRRLEARAQAAADRRDRADELLNSVRLQSDRPDAIQVRQIVKATEAELSFPKVLLVILFAVFMVTGSTAGIVVVKEALDQRVKSSQDMRLLPECNLLGVIPDSAEDPSNPKTIKGVVRSHPTGLMAESYRQVRAALLTQLDQHHLKSILLVGAQPDSGTSVVVNNLAISIALDGRSVLVVDANYRRPKQHEMFGTPIEPGLIEALAGSASLDDAVTKLEDPAVDVLPVGHAASATPEVFERAAFDKLLNELKERYEVILIDAPPALLTSDSSAIIKHVDAVAMVVRALEDKRGTVSRMYRLFTGHRARILGAILNGVRTSAGGYLRKNYLAFYRYQRSDAYTQPKAQNADIDLLLETEADES